MAVGTALGYEATGIVICPGPAQVMWAPSALPPIDLTVEAWAGGLVGGGVLLGAYGLAAAARMPARSPIAWAACLALAFVGSAQIVIGILEGWYQGRYVAAINEQPALLVSFILGAALAGASLHLIAYRRVLR